MAFSCSWERFLLLLPPTSQARPTTGAAWGHVSSCVLPPAALSQQLPLLLQGCCTVNWTFVGTDVGWWWLSLVGGSAVVTGGKMCCPPPVVSPARCVTSCSILQPPCRHSCSPTCSWRFLPHPYLCSEAWYLSRCSGTVQAHLCFHIAGSGGALPAGELLIMEPSETVGARAARWR